MALTLQIILVLSCLVLTMFVLLHKGKGGGLSSLFGGGVQSNLSGPTGCFSPLCRPLSFCAFMHLPLQPRQQGIPEFLSDRGHQRQASLQRAIQRSRVLRLQLSLLHQ